MTAMVTEKGSIQTKKHGDPIAEDNIHYNNNIKSSVKLCQISGLVRSHFFGEKWYFL